MWSVRQKDEIWQDWAQVCLLWSCCWWYVKSMPCKLLWSRCVVCKLSLHTDCAPGVSSLCLGPTATTSSPTLVRFFASFSNTNYNVVINSTSLIARWAAPLPGVQIMQEGLGQGRHCLPHQCCDDVVPTLFWWKFILPSHSTVWCCKICVHCIFWNQS